MLAVRMCDLLDVIDREGQAPSDMKKEEADYLNKQGLVKGPSNQTEVYDIQTGVRRPPDSREMEWRMLRVTPKGIETLKNLKRYVHGKGDTERSNRHKIGRCVSSGGNQATLSGIG